MEDEPLHVPSVSEEDPSVSIDTGPCRHDK